MACAIARSLINDEKALQIRSLLCMTPEIKKTRYNRDVETNPIDCYQIIDGVVHLPMAFGKKILDISNEQNKYPETGLAFTGNLRDYQVKVEEEAWQQMKTYGSTTLGLYPGFGKTILGAKLAARAKLLTIVLVTSTVLLGQWKKTFEDNTNSKDKIWIVGEKTPPTKCSVIICMDTRYEQIPVELRNKCGVLIIDEAHQFCTPSRINSILAFHPKYVVIESGSLEREDGMEKFIYAVAGTHNILRESEKPFTVYKIITHVKPKRVKTRTGDTNYAELQKSILFDERRNEIILESIKSNLKFKILILTSLVDHARLLHDRLELAGVSCDYLCGNKKGYSDSNVLVGTTSKIGTGFDPATSCPNYNGLPFDLLYIVSTIKKESMLVQNVGRCFRADFPTVMHFVDDDTIYQSHWYRCKKWYERRYGNIIEFKYPKPPEPKELTDEEWTKAKIAELKKKNKT
jgi:hypothetical protein